ncbi:DUF2924 domain-containing protein [Phenylobacterium sp.]|uniref:DUF2924 domain-containing protein n=1 Tax=Phenylobacterium sp. TaxID=1871053 RepID=UPI002604FE55|nr:DUF2924 domain-containing protein [Phenylobacterium sp.]
MARPHARKRAILSATLQTDLQQVEQARLPELRQIWTERLDEPLPPLRSPEIVRRMLAYRLQAAVHGGLSTTAKRKLAAIETRRTGPPPKKRAGAPLRLGVGAVLRREWQGVAHEVQVTASGFAHQGKAYRSLSEVARAITGSRWNGPLFFGLRDKTRAAGR